MKQEVKWPRSQAWYHANKERVLTRNRKNCLKLRLQTLEAYGNKCACCGETQLAFLAIDHINGGGTKERKASNGGTQVFRRLRRENWPSGYQVLCHNCNMAKAFYEKCPHSKE